jgi:hypothetical protein
MVSAMIKRDDGDVRHEHCRGAPQSAAPRLRHWSLIKQNTIIFPGRYSHPDDRLPCAAQKSPTMVQAQRHNLRLSVIRLQGLLFVHDTRIML